MIHDLKRQGLSVLAIARRTGHDPKTVRKYLNTGLEAPSYGPRAPRGSVLDAYAHYIRGKLKAYPDLSAARLFREGSHGIEDDASGHIGRARGARLGQERPRKSFLRSPTSENGPSTNSLMCQTQGRESQL